MKGSIFVGLILISFLYCVNGSVTPIVLWHGLGDSCCFSFSLGALMTKLNDSLPGIHILSLRIGSSVIADVENGFFKHPDKQIKEACDIISADPLLTDGFNAIGLSQGAQFLRALVQRCPEAKIKNLISLGGQHQGVYGLPSCGALAHSTCDDLRKLLNYAAYFRWVQAEFVPATYWHDPLKEAEYVKYSSFLADINNENLKNTDYINNLQRLENFVLVKFENDTTVQPVATEWFGFYKPGQSIEIQSLEESALYIDDRLGLQKMNDDGKLHFLGVPGDHLRFEWNWFEENIINPFLNY